MKGDGKSVFDLETRFKLEDARVASGSGWSGVYVSLKTLDIYTTS